MTSLSVLLTAVPLFALLLFGMDYQYDAFAQYSKSPEDSTKDMTRNIDTSMSPPVEGSEDAPITIIEFGDFQCPKCDQWFQNEKPAIKQDYIETGKANLYFVDFTFLGDDSVTAANAAYCADEQGMYWEYHSHLYNNQGGINEGWASPTNLKLFASDVGLDAVAFDECLKSGKYNDRIAYNKQVGLEHGVEGTPAFFIIDNSNSNPTERIDGPQPSTIFADVIDRMLGDSIVPDVSASEDMLSDTEEEIMETVSEIKEDMQETVSELEIETKQMVNVAGETLEETSSEISETMSEAESQVEETADNIETMADERPEINVSTGDNAENGGGCLIATAAYGTELAPQVQFLREIRDNTLMSTTSGTAFMAGFNQLYYSFSPTIADLERENPVFQDAVRAFITPMISSLSIMTLAEDGSEMEVLGLGLLIILLNIGMYVGAPMIGMFTINKYVKVKHQN